MLRRLNAIKTEKEAADMNRQHEEASGIQRFLLEIFDRCMLRERKFGQIYAYVNPWSAAMDDDIENSRIRASQKAALKRAARRRAENSTRAEGPVARM
jgi:hypothetical protein